MRAYCAPACNILSHHRLLSLWTRLLPIWNACHRQQAALQRGYQIQNLYVHCIIRAPSISLWHELSVVFCGCFPPKGCTVQLFKQLIRECTHAHTRPSVRTHKRHTTLRLGHCAHRSTGSLPGMAPRTKRQRWQEAWLPRASSDN